ncbi:MAG TPA: glycine cleavage system aminomethyltransferase GcvT [Oligoflexia bacterium]|nr:glycine cleavage system aminomethyltransferase GcvT [Oligoflexia bacterium]HMR23747.1 glycine cleavage system aminomethyltransferase GcvT [Oligoflexia bacterium]
MNELRKTPVYDLHVKSNAKMVEFGGWSMPIQYSTGIISEYEAVRNTMGLFDVSHMGEIEISGRDALAFCQKVASNNVAKLKPGKVQYAAIINHDAKMIDDCTIYCLAADKFLFVVNASHIEEVYDWFINNKANENVEIKNKSYEYALFALQGPKSDAFLSELVKRNLNETIRYYEFNIAQINDVACLISRTGYTGEDGFEIYFDSKEAAKLWTYLIEQGTPLGLLPIGLGARDLLRLEMGYLLSGQDFDKNTHVLEAALGWVTKLDKGSFIGKDAVEKVKEHGVKQRIRAFKLLSKGVPREGYEIWLDAEKTKKLGRVTSGSFSPQLKQGIGLAMISSEVGLGSEVFIELRKDKMVKAEICKAPFVESSVKKS